ncbi:MAG: PAS domain S-box protein [Methanomicrobiales archaeon]|nr:PAS domain S-box protein [Methanomicrobiales archaeon]
MIDYAVRAYSNTTIEQGLVTDMEEGYHEEISRIRALLFENPVGMSIKDIATALSLNRNTVTRYLDLLQVQGSVDARRIGTSRVYALSQRVPAAPLLTCTPGPAVLIDQNLAVTTLNEQFQKTFSLTTSDWTGRSASDLPFLTQDQAGEVSAFRVAIRSALRGTPGTMVVRGPPHGISDTSLSLLPVVFENGKPGVAILLTGAGTKEGYTTKSPTLEEQYLALTKDQAEAVCRFTPDGTITFANPRASDILGLPLEDMVGQTFRLIVQGEDHDRFEATLAALSPVKPQGTVETRLILSSGDVGWLRWRLRALFGGNGQVVEYQAMGLDITEYKRALERLKRYHETLEDLVEARTLDLRESNQQLMQEIARRERLERELLLAKFATDAAGEMIIWLDEDQRFLYANKAALFTLGYAWSELGRMKIGEVTPGGPFGNGAKEVRSLISTVAEGEVGTFVGDLVIRDGGTIPVEMTLNRIQFRNRDLTCCFARDITARRFAEDTQRESEEKFRTLAEETEVGIFILNGDALTYINPAFTRITGFFIEELGIRGFYSLIHPDFSGIVEPEIRSSLATQGCMVKRTFKIVRSDAKERWVSFTGTKIVLRGRPAFLGTFLDITEERMREEEVRNLAAIVSSSEDAIFSKNMEGTVQTWNIGAEKVYGYSAGEIIGKHVALLLPPGSSDDLNEILKKVRLGEKIDHYETRRRRKDGTVIDVSITVSPVSTIGGVITGASIIGRDISER